MTPVNFLERTEEELLEIIGQSIADKDLGFFPLPKSREALKRAAIQWMQNNWELIQKTICHREGIRKLFESPERELLFHLLCDILSATIVGVHVGALSAYLIRRGHKFLCRDSSAA